MSYKTIIMDKLLAGETISPISALKEFGCFSLAQRISELRASGVPILGKRVDLPNGKHHHKYWLDKADIIKLRGNYGTTTSHH